MLYIGVFNYYLYIMVYRKICNIVDMDRKKLSDEKARLEILKESL